MKLPPEMNLLFVAVVLTAVICWTYLFLEHTV